jgi:hypothetical protein
VYVGDLMMFHAFKAKLRRSRRNSPSKRAIPTLDLSNHYAGESDVIAMQWDG